MQRIIRQDPDPIQELTEEVVSLRKTVANLTEIVTQIAQYFPRIAEALEEQNRK